jgi:hypothetical protein
MKIFLTRKNPAQGPTEIDAFELDMESEKMIYTSLPDDDLADSTDSLDIVIHGAGGIVIKRYKNGQQLNTVQKDNDILLEEMIFPEKSVAFYTIRPAGSFMVDGIESIDDLGFE